MAPRPKQEYEERPSDDDGTPFDRFARIAKRVIGVPKPEIEDREREWKQREQS